jgi:hypothetical protein
LDEVLLLLRGEPAELREGIEEELAWLSNKVVACDGIDFASEERVRRGVERARHFVNIGLEAWCGRQLSKGGEVLKERWLEVVFRWGVSQLIFLREETSGIIRAQWQASHKAFLDFLDPPYESIFRGLLRQVPEYYDASVRDNPDLLRDFRNLEEVEKTHQSVEQVKKVFQFLNQRLPSLPPQPTSLFSLLGTLFAHFVLEDKIGSRFLSAKEVTSFLKKGFETGPSGRVVHAKLKEKFIKDFSRASDQELLRSFWALVFERMEEDLGRLDAARPVDPRFVSSLSIGQL